MKHNLLIVDDNEMMRAFLSHYFSASYQVKMADGGIEAWQLLDEGYFPDLILLDLRMPDISGIDMLRQLKSSVIFHDIPVIMVSSITKSGEKIDCLQAGAADYITKPFNPKEVEARVQYHLKAKRV
ncbi:response regulator transcription factor [Lewinella sp. LCG006]|uniref:response regulator transcription factor n=1 Tax=Lewinella sp. LCG006 TaxID=3231911 RepID=UPI0034604706